MRAEPMNRSVETLERSPWRRNCWCVAGLLLAAGGCMSTLRQERPQLPSAAAAARTKHAPLTGTGADSLLPDPHAVNKLTSEVDSPIDQTNVEQTPEVEMIQAAAPVVRGESEEFDEQTE